VEVLVTYDVSTDTVEGRRRLRRVAKACEGFGQRVQKSVFEGTVNQVQLTEWLHRLRLEIDPDQDSLRVYRLREPRAQFLEVIGRSVDLDIHDPLIL
jgi:CRISPR-associated protein Cas2